MRPILTALAVYFAAMWIATFVGELVASRRGLPCILDTPDLPPDTARPRALAWWKHALWWALLIVVVVPLTALAIILVAPPLLGVNVIARRAHKAGV